MYKLSIINEEDNFIFFKVSFLNLKRKIISISSLEMTFYRDNHQHSSTGHRNARRWTPSLMMTIEEVLFFEHFGSTEQSMFSNWIDTLTRSLRFTGEFQGLEKFVLVQAHMRFLFFWGELALKRIGERNFRLKCLWILCKQVFSSLSFFTNLIIVE